MSTKLDQSLDEILGDKKKARRGQQKAGPVGGVRKRSARIEQKKKTAPAAPVASKKTEKSDKTDVKIQVSNLPLDVNESMLREYFTSIVGPVKKCHLNYKANGQSSGVATIEFSKPGAANIAFEQFNGRLVDNRPMKVEIIVDPTKVPLANRISGNPKNAPKGAAAKNTPKPAGNTNKPKPATNGRANGAGGRNGAGRGRPGRGGRSGSGAKRAPKKTVEELDQEMADYYKTTDSNAAPAAAPTAADAAAMEDL